MPPLALLKPVVWAPATRLAMLVLRGYLVVSVLLLIVKAVQLGRGGLRRAGTSARRRPGGGVCVRAAIGCGLILCLKRLSDHSP
jgi:hypothetical protein